MTDVTFQFVLRVGDALTNATSVVLSDSTGTYGAKRLDNDAIVVAANTAMTNASTGVYRYTFTPPVQGLTYSWVAKVVRNGVTSYFEQEATDTVGSDATGYYADLADVESRIGTPALEVMSNLNGEAGSINAAQVQLALDDADTQIDLFLRSNGYTTPVPSTSDDFESLTDVAAHLAAVWLHDRRGWREDADMSRQRKTWQLRASERLNRLATFGLKSTRHNSTEIAPTWPVTVG